MAAIMQPYDSFLICSRFRDFDILASFGEIWHQETDEHWLQYTLWPIVASTSSMEMMKMMTMRIGHV